MEDKMETVGVPEVRRPTVYDKIKACLSVASQLIIAAPVKLPARVVAVAKYVALALGMLEAVEGRKDEGSGDDENR